MIALVSLMTGFVALPGLCWRVIWESEERRMGDEANEISGSRSAPNANGLSFLSG